jgi:hypothetical protein
MKQAFLIALLATLSGATPVFSVSPASQNVLLGSTATVQITVSGLGLDAAPSLGAYDLNIAFDPTILSFTGLTFGDPLNGDQLDLSGAGPISDFNILSPGVLEFFEISLDSSMLLDTQQLDQFVLATLQFSTLNRGMSDLTPSVNSAGDSGGASLDSSVVAGQINVAAAPEPGTIALFAIGILICLCVRKP